MRAFINEININGSTHLNIRAILLAAIVEINQEQSGDGRKKRKKKRKKSVFHQRVFFIDW